MSKTLVVGVGNVFRGDDGFGPAVVSALKKKKLSSDIDVIDAGTPGLELLLSWQGYSRVILVDAADMGLRPGQCKRFLPDDVTSLTGSSRMGGSLHSAGVAEAIELAKALDCLPERLIFYAVQPAQINWSGRLSDEVQAAVLPVCRSIVLELEEISQNS